MQIALLAAAAVIVIWNIVTFSMYAIDKKRAASGAWRIKEATLIGSAFLMGGLGALLGMNILRHKTQHIQFKILIPLALVLKLAVIAAVVYFACIR